ncbi:MAG: hypothetical protein PHR77_17630 [Kiritimatiellae bacterium]|nr:hypothetical protein [Kiritimatiellia bacterium]MDD5522765.1 hypothetical protein [Kiritimatiellia bacterium]
MNISQSNLLRLSTNRRNFLKSTAALAGMSLLSPHRVVCAEEKKGTIKFLFPMDGDMLNANDGEQKDGSLYFTAKLSVEGCPAEGLRVNGILATRTGENEFEARLRLDGYRNTLTASAKAGECEKIVVYWLPKAVGKFQYYIDDNIWWLKDIARSNYKSIYENPFINFFHSLYKKYGALIHMHIYYYDDVDGFTLYKMPDKYKPEFRQAAEWLRLTFHAYANAPSFPHRNSTYEYTLKCLDQVHSEIVRFAGEELLSPATVPHFNEMSVGAARAFRARGIKIIPGLSRSAQYVKRGLDAHVKERDFWYDNDEDIIMPSSDICCNRVKLADIVPHLEKVMKDPKLNGFLYMMIHEQYFYPFYRAYMSDYRERVETAVRFAWEHGYKSAWVEDVVLEKLR